MKPTSSALSLCLVLAACGPSDHEAETLSHALAAEVPQLLVSLAPDRGQPLLLDNGTLAGPAFVFYAEPRRANRVITHVDFFQIDSRTDRHARERLPDYDFNRTAPDGSAYPFDFGALGAGTHQLHARVSYSDGGHRRLSATFVVPAASAEIVETFSGADGTSPSPLWAAQGAWTVGNGVASNVERGFASLVTARTFERTAYTVESRASGWAPLEGPSPADEITLVFGGAPYDGYHLTYFPSQRRLALRLVTSPAGGEIKTKTLAETELDLSLATWARLRVVADGSGRIEAFVSTDDATSWQAALEARDVPVRALGRFGWLLGSQGTGLFQVDEISAR